MQNQGLTEFKFFKGTLEANNCIVPLDFSARINSIGEVEFNFDKIILSNESSFIIQNWQPNGSKLSYFSLSGKALDETEFTTKSLFFNTDPVKINEKDIQINLTGGRCSQARFHRKMDEPKPNPCILMWLKGFWRAHPLNHKCDLGTISMVKEPSNIDSDEITGFIKIESDSEQSDLSVWQDKATKLLEHVQKLMSFASGLILRAPIIEFYAGSNLEVVVSPQIRQASSDAIPVFRSYSQQPIFDVAVTSFICPPLEINNLFIAIEWFAMNSTYAEVRLVNAMTVLENLISSNLDDNDSLILPAKEFEKDRRALRKVLNQCIKKWSRDQTKKPEVILLDINERLADLNRRSILQKLNILAKRWSVPLDGISWDQIKAAKKARDLIVHQGHYSKDGDNNLWELSMVVREIVVRFILTAIGYQGQYISHLGGCHNAQFPPKIEDV